MKYQPTRVTKYALYAASLFTLRINNLLVAAVSVDLRVN